MATSRAPAPPTSARSSRSSSSSSNTAPSELRNYRLQGIMRHDELSTVYRATHLTLNRPVSVHVLRRSDWVAASRFQLAGRLAARLTHPNLLPVIDAGTDERYGEYLVTPLIEGETLEAMQTQGALDPVQVLSIATQVAAALDYLHDQQVIHRDVQPNNVFVTPQGAVYLMNLSWAASAETPDLSSVDQADFLTAYSAPEQHLDPASAAPTLDVYGLGAICWQALTGSYPPDGRTTLASINGGLAALEPVLHKMLAEQPAARYNSPGEAVVAMRKALRPQVDASTPDMEEMQWDATAEWLENPLETVLGALIDRDYIQKSRQRADELHQPNAVRRVLNRWSRQGFFRRTGLGQLIRIDQVVSYNIYFYEVRAVYETRSDAQSRRRPQKNERAPTQLPPDIWEAPVPAPPDTSMSNVTPREIVLPNSLRLLTCPACEGTARILCKQCNGSGVRERVLRQRQANGTFVEQTVTEPCDQCKGYGKLTCGTCEGSGALVEEQVFMWSRRARIWENTDDIEDLPEKVLRARTEPIFEGAINPYDGHWHSIAPLAEVLKAGIDDAGENTRLIEAILRIRGAPVTEINYRYNEKPHRLLLLGFDSKLSGNWTLYNLERVALVAIGVLLIILLFTVVKVSMG